ncbi:B3 domain-containing protein [Striga asiatica]|uniref:B3 domain-containing protein n=1 Tax=Striga asiatica TaxID=4170 RepID=A0A5A7RG45_STRAF|nr:B3 domain-containing protein [Striga asiatica]
MSEYFQRFFKYIVNPEKRTLKLPDSLNHQYSHRTPVECTLTTREGRRHIVTLRGNRFRVYFDEGWRDFVHGEDIMVDNCLWFDRTSFTDFIVTVHGEDQVERDLRYRYTLEIKKCHVERVFDIHAKTVYLHEDDREEALEVWALAEHYCSNNPEPLWETLKIIFEPLGLDPYPGEMRARDERNLRKLDQVIREYWAEERRMAAQRRRRGN